MGLTREQLFRALGIIKDVDLEAITKKAMVQYETDAWREVGDHPITSFWCSQFPGEENLCCNTRGLLYNLMNIPQVDPIPPRLRGQAEMGNAVEAFVLRSWEKAGILLSSQVKVEDEETWLSGAIDAVLDLRPQLNKLVPIDIKSKDHEVIKQMKLGMRSYDHKHYLQVQSYIYLWRKLQEIDGIDWEGLREVDSGMLYYVSRQDPTYVKEFYFNADDVLIEKSAAQLKELKNNFIAGTLPERPDGLKWSEPPARWCGFKKECCKKDFVAGITTLAESNGIEFAKHVKPSYDYEKTRRKVLGRWT